MADKAGRNKNQDRLMLAVVVVVAAGLFYVFGPGKGGVADPNNNQQVAMGQSAYRNNCASCHGMRLEGQPNWRQRNPDGTLPAPPHDETGHTWHHPDQLLFDITKRGGAASAPAGFKSAMPGFGGVMSDEQIWAVLAYIKSRWPADVLARQNRISTQSN